MEHARPMVPNWESQIMEARSDDVDMHESQRRMCDKIVHKDWGVSVLDHNFLHGTMVEGCRTGTAFPDSVVLDPREHRGALSFQLVELTSLDHPWAAMHWTCEDCLMPVRL